MDQRAEKVSSVCSECGATVTFDAGATQVSCSYCDAGLAVGGETRLVRLDCPICAGNFFYIDGRMAGQCPYCQAPLLALTRHRLLRYVIRPQAPRPADGAELLLIPFWLLSALHYGFDVGSKITVEIDSGPSMQSSHNQDPDDVVPAVTRRDSGPQKLFRGRVVERWIADPVAQSVGVESLRMRASYYALEPLTSEHEGLGRVLAPTLAIDDARQQLYGVAMTIGYTADGLTKLDCQRSDLVAESISLLYYPFWVQPGAAGAGPKVWDGVNGEPEPIGAPRAVQDQGAFTSAFDELKVVELRCQRCGERLTVGSHGVVFPCHPCDTFWVAEREGLEPFSAAYAKPQVANEGDHPLLWLPFWRAQAKVSYFGQQATQVLHARTLLNVMRPPGDMPSAANDAPLCYFVPAYGAKRAPRLDFAARDLNRLQPKLEGGSYSAGSTFSCFFGPEDALKLAYVVWLQILPGAVPKRLASLRVETGLVELWYVPFADRGREVTNLLTGMRYDRAVFRGVGH